MRFINTSAQCLRPLNTVLRAALRTGLTTGLTAVAALVASLIMVTFQGPDASAMQGLPAESEATSENLKITYSFAPNDGSLFKDVKVTAAYGPEATAELAAEVAAETEAPLRATTVIEPSDKAEVSARYFQKIRELAPVLKVGARKRYKLNSEQFGDWFVKNRLRISVVAMQFTLMTGLKFVELVIAPVPLPYASALVASLLMGTVLGTVEWNTQKFIRFIMEPGALVKAGLDKISQGAATVWSALGKNFSPDEKNLKAAKIRSFFNTAWIFAKNTGVNFGLFGVFKIILYASTQSDGTVYEPVLHAFMSITGLEVFEWARLAAASTLVSLPTTMLISKKHKETMNQADSPEAEARARNTQLLHSSSALTARAVFFSMVILSGVAHWPALAIVGYSGLGLMFSGSIYKLWTNARNAKRANSCSAIFAPLGSEAL